MEVRPSALNWVAQLLFELKFGEWSAVRGLDLRNGIFNGRQSGYLSVNPISYRIYGADYGWFLEG